MERYLGVKLIEAEPEYKPGLRHEGDVDNLKGDGYKVVYEDGYESWSPKDVFEKAYRKIDGLTFGLAIEALKLGYKVSRQGWNGKNMFVFKQIPALIDLPIIPKMQSVPQSVKDTMIDRSQRLNYRNQCVIVDSSGNVDNWSPSINDCFAEDWKIIN